MTKEFKDWLFVKADNFENAEIHNGILYYLETGGQSIRSRLQLPPGSWQIIGKGGDPKIYRKVFRNDNGVVVLRSLGFPHPSEVLILKNNEK